MRLLYKHVNLSLCCHSDAPSGTLGPRPTGSCRLHRSLFRVTIRLRCPPLFSLPSNGVLFMPLANDTGDTRNSAAPNPCDVRSCLAIREKSNIRPWHPGHVLVIYCTRCRKLSEAGHRDVSEYIMSNNIWIRPNVSVSLFISLHKERRYIELFVSAQVKYCWEHTRLV